MVGVRDSRADTRVAIIDPMEERGESALVALALALGARDVGGALSAVEADLTKGAEGVHVAERAVDEARAAILDGGDPLGSEFYRLRTPLVRRQAGAVYTPEALVEPMVRWTLEQQPSRVIDPGAGSGRFSTAVARLGLFDGRLMPLECKVSNSSTNSIKRLNNDAAVKAATWIDEFGRLNVVPAAVLSGVFKVKNLEQAQERGLTIYWAHDLDRLVEFINATN